MSAEFNEGMAARKANQTKDSCPYSNFGGRRSAWLQGWEKADGKIMWGNQAFQNGAMKAAEEIEAKLGNSYGPKSGMSRTEAERDGAAAGKRDAQNKRPEWWGGMTNPYGKKLPSLRKFFGDAWKKAYLEEKAKLAKKK